jgi:hypothetical protein
MKRGIRWPAGLLAVVLGTGAMAAEKENPKIEAIRRLYQAALAPDEGEDGEENTGGLSLSGSRIMPGTGNQNVSVTFHEVRLRSEPRMPFVLRLITVEYNVAAHPFRQEFLFNDAGQLVFHFRRDDCGEHRGYFDGGKLLRVVRQRVEEGESCQEKIPGPARLQKDTGFSAAEQQQAREVQENAQTLNKLYTKALW